MGRLFIITEAQAKLLQPQEKVTSYEFFLACKNFLVQLLEDPSNPNIEIPELFKNKGMSREDIIRLFLDYKILVQSRDIKGDTYVTKYTLNNSVFKRNISQMYAVLFECEVPSDKPNLNETCDAGNSGQFVASSGFMARRSMPFSVLKPKKKRKKK